MDEKNPGEICQHEKKDFKRKPKNDGTSWALKLLKSKTRKKEEGG